MIALLERFSMGDNKRFHVREHSFAPYEVYGKEATYAYCLTLEKAELICRLLEDHFDNLESQSDYDFHK